MNVLIIGLGSIAKKHIEALQTIYSDIVFYALRSSNRGQDEKGVHNIFHIRDIVEKPDFIIISNSTELHAKAIFETIKLEYFKGQIEPDVTTVIFTDADESN